MNKNFLQIAFLLLGVSGMNAQDSFFESTTFSGALSADASKDWTKTGWTNFDPKNTAYPSVNEEVTLAAGNGVKEITTAVTLDASKTYLLSGIVAIKEGGSLTIPAGTVIRGYRDVDASAGTSNYAMIIVERGGKIYVNGTASQPVVITSNAPVGQRDRGDWAGLVLTGRARTNQSGPLLEGFNKLTGYLSGGGGAFGGNDDSDNSGVINYLRVEFAGLALDVNKEINGVTFGGVGAGTQVDYIQVSYSNDDSFEWFGGNVNAKHLIAYIGTDDDFDTDFGYSGKVQYGIGLKHPLYFDATYSAASGASTSEGFESDNDAQGSTNTPYTSAIFSNFTMVGPISQDSTYATTKSATTKNAFRRGARLRRNSKQSIVKTLFMGYRNFLLIDGSASLANYGVTANPQVFRTDSARFQDNIFVNSAAAQAYSASSVQTYNGLVEVASVTKSGSTVADTAKNNLTLNLLDAWVKNPININLINTVPFGPGTILIDPQNFTNPNFRPISEAVVSAVGDVTYDLNLGVYPNPVAQNTSLIIAEKEESFALINALGVVVKSGFANKVEMNGVEKGLYVIKVGKKSTKVVVE